MKAETRDAIGLEPWHLSGERSTGQKGNLKREPPYPGVFTATEGGGSSFQGVVAGVR